MKFVATIVLDPGTCIVLAVDLQEGLIPSIDGAQRVVRRSEYLVRCATAIGIPSLLTTQNADKLGPLSPQMKATGAPTLDKRTFSCWHNKEIREFLLQSAAKQVVLCGAETHICVSLTALDLLANGFAVAVCPDAVGSSDMERHKLGMERMRDAGIVPIHSEAVAYEWLRTSEHLRFRDILALTKSLR